jgi:UDP-N-acetylglucosamine--N-acetylmuramyl-(pentapeptide) pyrophosphoryl-undecaprenol N-acetylglucosamine transferase
VYPLVAVLQQLAATQILNLRNDVLYVGRGASVEERIASRLNIPFAGIRVGGLRSLGALTQARNFSHMMRASRVAVQELEKFKPNVVLATGGYVSAPVIWAAWRKKIPVVIELPDLEPGWAIRATWRLSRQVAVSFDEVLKFFPRGRATVTGYPVRAEFFQATRDAGRAHFQLDHEMPGVTVFGGSQGAHALNEIVRANLRELLQTTQILHVCGVQDKTALDAERAMLETKLAARYHVFEYLNEDMPLSLAAADVVVARAGAATLGEFPAVGVPSILVPGLFAQGHQSKNAEFLASRGAAIALEEEKLALEFVPTLMNLLDDPTRLQRMRDAVKKLARPEAAKQIGELLQEVRA